jgi:hypothetical protein
MATDSELRARILKTLYDNRLKTWIKLPTADLEDIGLERLHVVCRQLDEHGLMRWKAYLGKEEWVRLLRGGSTWLKVTPRQGWDFR